MRTKKDETPVIEQPEVREITAMYPEQVFTPFSYNSFRVGPIYYRTFVKPGETDEEAYQRAWDFVYAQARAQYIKVSADFYERHKGVKI